VVTNRLETSQQIHLDKQRIALVGATIAICGRERLTEAARK
jgi:uncharacterized membrane protein YadS